MEIMIDITNHLLLTLFRVGLSGTAHGLEVAKKVSLSKICYTFPILMKLGTVIPYLRKIQKLHISRDTPLDLC